MNDAFFHGLVDELEKLGFFGKSRAQKMQEAEAFVDKERLRVVHRDAMLLLKNLVKVLGIGERSLMEKR